jgi:exopolysaccharide biosynthesis operon protein EpsL
MAWQMLGWVPILAIRSVGPLLKIRSWNLRRAAPGLGAIALFAAGAIEAADGDSLRMNVSSGISYDSNLFRLPDSVSPSTVVGRGRRSDVITTTGVGAAFDHTYSRQQVTAEARARHNDYSEFDFLDNQSYDGSALLRWQIGADWSGDLEYSRAKALTGFGDLRLPVKNMQTTARGNALARYRLGAPLALRAQVTGVGVDNSSAALTTNDRRERTYETGIDFLPGTGNTLGAFVRRTDGDVVNRIVTPTGDSDTFKEDTAGSNFFWRIAGHSTLYGYVGYTQRRYANLTQRDFSGVSGLLNYAWRPGGKTTLNVTARRQVEGYEDVSTTYALANSIAAEANWAATAKIAVAARAEYRQREFLGDTGTLPGVQQAREDRTRSAGVGVIYRPLRNVELAVGVARESRTSNRALLDYGVTTASVTAQVTF